MKRRVGIPLKDVGGFQEPWRDLLSEKEFHPKKDLLSLSLQPYDVLWLVPESQTTQTAQC
jgi:hypothetical protein